MTKDERRTYFRYAIGVPIFCIIAFFLGLDIPAATSVQLYPNYMNAWPLLFLALGLVGPGATISFILLNPPVTTTSRKRWFMFFLCLVLNIAWTLVAFSFARHGIYPPTEFFASFQAGLTTTNGILLGLCFPSICLGLAIWLAWKPKVDASG